MFDDDDAEKMVFKGRIPDGFIDGSQYSEIFQNILGHMKELKNESDFSNVTWVMKCVNECYKDNGDGTSSVDSSKATDVVTALAYYVMTLIRGIDEDDLEEYFRVHDEEVVPDMVSNAQTIPWYDIMDEVKALVELFDEMDGLNTASSDEDNEL